MLAEETPGRDPEHESCGGRVLIVDDEPQVLAALRHQLRREFDVVTAENGAEALEILRHEPVDVIIADQRLPQMTGSEVLAAARALNGDAARIMLTSYADLDAVVDAINQAQIYGYVTTPWDGNEIRTTVRTAIQRARLQKENRELLSTLEASDRRKDEFLAVLAHELRNPLAPIRNAVDILRLQGLSDPTAQAARDIIDRQLHQLVRLVDDLLDANRLNRGELLLRKERVELAAVVEQAVEGARPQILSGGQELTLSLPQHSVHLEADPVRLVQVFQNLLINASKHTEKGGHIRLRAGSDASSVTVAIEDTGVGIAAKDLPHIFEMFTKIAPQMAQTPLGIGVGLALTRELVEMHGGSIAARSEGPGKGTAFIVRLPLAVEERLPQSSARGDGDNAETASARRVLVVDDDLAVAQSLSLLLRVLGNQAEIAHDGLAAIALAERLQPEVILLDIGMPILDGYETCRRIRAEPWGKSIKIVAVTGWGSNEDRRKSAEAGFDAHLVKPAAASSLSQVLGDPSSLVAR
jgi:signal transduction histidine kinase